MPADRVAEGLRTIEIREALGQIDGAMFGSELRHDGKNRGAETGQFAPVRSVHDSTIARV